MSSRNAYLDPNERKIAGNLNRILKDISAKIRAGTLITNAEASGHEELKKVGFSSVDYLTVRDATTLSKLQNLSEPARVLVAAKLGKTRLIDNIPV
jgi:pantoate--beta-alanine ligase